jgi:hypothetical protein
MHHFIDPSEMPDLIRSGFVPPMERPKIPSATPFDPAPVAALLDEQWAAWPALATALRACTKQWAVDEDMCYLMDPADPATCGPFKAIIWVHSAQLGTIMLEVLNDGRIISMEFREEEWETTFLDVAAPIPMGIPMMHIAHRRTDE